VTLCQQGQHWQWDNADFTVLYPTQETLALGNDSSCVLQVRAGDKTILLTGDIERRAEQALVQQYGDKLQSTLLFAPHHGSKTSSTLAFIEKVRPQLVIFSTGYLNRYHFPSSLVQQRYTDHAISTLNTAETGAITVTLQSHRDIEVLTQREKRRRFWE
jgi:competence protein ComEC